MKQTKKQKFENMTVQEKMDYIKEIQEQTNRRNKITNLLSNVSIGLSITSILLLILANLDEIVSFVHYVLSYLH